MAVHASVSRERWEAEQAEHGMALQDQFGSPGSEGPGDEAWQGVLAQLAQAQRNEPRMS